MTMEMACNWGCTKKMLFNKMMTLSGRVILAGNKKNVIHNERRKGGDYMCKPG